VGPVEADSEGPDGLTIALGLSSGESKEVRCKCETVTRRQTRERIRTTDGIRFVEVPKVLILERALSM
jgi:hypothetical protein